MKTLNNRFTVALGIALLLQAVTSLVSGGILFAPLVDKTDIATTMTNIAQNQFKANLSIFLDIVTALGIVWLAVLLYSLLRKVNQIGATTALALYILEASILVMSKFAGYALIQVSGMYASTGDQTLQATGQLLLQVKDFSYNMHMVPCGIGAILFYYLLFKSKTLPSWIPMWGLVTMIPVVIGTLLRTYGVEVPIAVMLPYVPFEFFAGAFILIRGLSDHTVSEPYAVPTNYALGQS
jgi:hypothetical protein